MKNLISYHHPLKAVKDRLPVTEDKDVSILALIARETINSIIITDLEGKITWVNDAFTRTTGYTSEEVMGKLPGPLLSCAEKDKETKRYLDEKIKNKESFRVEIENRKKNGGTFWWEVYYQPLFDEDGNIVRFFSLNTDITEKKLLQKQLDEERYAFSKRITAAAIKAQEMERCHVSRELHDNVNQVLTTIKLYTELCSSGSIDPATILPKCTQLLDQTINDIRSLSQRLSAPSVGDGGIKETLLQLVSHVEATQQVQLIFNPSNLPTEELDKELHLAIYRIAQEQLTNILKHAEANVVLLFFERTANELILYIQDDGKGFNTQKKYNGIGITNMISRAEILNGNITIRSSEGQGCTLTASFPIVVENGKCQAKQQ